MPRGKKSAKNYEADIAIIDEKVARYKSLIAGLEEKKEKLFEDKRNSEMKEVYDLMNQKGLSPKDLLDFLDTTKE